MEAGAFTYPKLHFFKSGNPYYGSYKGLNYKITPREDMLDIIVWYGLYCSSVSETVAQTVLPMTEEGLENSREYLWDQYKQMLSNTAKDAN